MIHCLVSLGRIEESKPVAQKLLKIAPLFTVSSARDRYPIRNPEFIERSCAALRAAGIPE
jgi:hypothetical protein